MAEPVPRSLTPAAPNLARTLLALAAEIEADEARIREELLASARRGDLARVTTILCRWRDCPVREVLAGPEHQQDCAPTRP